MSYGLRFLKKHGESEGVTWIAVQSQVAPFCLSTKRNDNINEENKAKKVPRFVPGKALREAVK